MTIKEMHYDFRIKKDQVEALNAKAFLDNEIDWLLNQAQLLWVKSKLNIVNPRRSGLEQDQKRIEDLKQLLVKFPEQESMSVVHHEDEHIYELDLSKLKFPYLYYVRSWVEVISPKCISKALVKIIQHDDIYHALADPFNTSDIDTILANFGRSSNVNDSSSLYLYPSTEHSLGKIYLEYLRYPPNLSLGTYQYLDGKIYPEQSCILSDHTHPEIVNMAVQIAANMADESGTYKSAFEQTQFSD